VERPWKVLAAEASRWVLVAALLIGALLLLVPTHGDGNTYSCHEPPVWLLVHPAAEESAAFRKDFFDDGYQCNQDARWRVGTAATVLASGGLPYLLLRGRRAGRSTEQSAARAQRRY
jgi:hypothetical protein